MKKIKKERWDLHIYAGFLLGLLISSILIMLGTMVDLNYLGYTLIITTLGFIIGQGFEIFQSNNSGKFVSRYKKLYDWGILSKTHNVKPDYRDAIATAVGFLLSTPLTWWLAIT